MTGQECEQLALDNSWSLARTNACHLSVQNHEMGELRDEMIDTRIEMKQFHHEILLKFEHYSTLQNVQIGAWSLIASTMVVLVIKKIWGKK